ncbi:hypothetical protein, partial [Peribacillus simplex]|uniref:hypothetical protein n=1 Tax=Peribacillus simplex TaxID=1478 RepID=UPI0019D6AB5B
MKKFATLLLNNSLDACFDEAWHTVGGKGVIPETTGTFLNKKTAGKHALPRVCLQSETSIDIYTGSF